jgi:hypothetical protein
MPMRAPTWSASVVSCSTAPGVGASPTSWIVCSTPNARPVIETGTQTAPSRPCRRPRSHGQASRASESLKDCAAPRRVAGHSDGSSTPHPGAASPELIARSKIPRPGDARRSSLGAPPVAAAIARWAVVSRSTSVSQRSSPVATRRSKSRRSVSLRYACSRSALTRRRSCMRRSNGRTIAAPITAIATIASTIASTRSPAMPVNLGATARRAAEIATARPMTKTTAGRYWRVTVA